MKQLHLPHPQAAAISFIRQFFDIWSVAAVSQQINNLFAKAASQKAWRPANPWHAVHLCRQLKKLGKAAAVLNNPFIEPLAKAIIIKHGDNGPDFSKHQHYLGDNRFATPFSDLPRNIGVDEYRYPAKALRRYCCYRPKKYWKNFYRQLAECALSTSSLQDFENSSRLFKIRSLVLSLVEGCHIIHVRLGNTPVVISNETMAG